MQNRTFLIIALVCLSAILAPAQETFDSVFIIGRAEALFDVNSHVLQPAADSVLRDIAEKCMSTQRRSLVVEAHTDSDGSDVFNQALSERRAEAVRSYLESLGVAAGQMTVLAFGEKRPATLNATETGKQLNRRVTVELWQRTQMAWLQGQVVDASTQEGIAATLSIRSKFLNDSLQTDSTGHFRTPVPDRMPVEVSVFAPGHFFETKMLKTGDPNPLPLVFSLPRALEGEVFTLKNLYFVGNQDTLLVSSEPELPKLLTFMRMNPGIRIEIAGHINLPNSQPVPKESWNYKLSVRRAFRVYQYLVDKGISEEQMTYKGYGNYQMVFPRARTEKEQALNRRVEIRVLEAK